MKKQTETLMIQVKSRDDVIELNEEEFLTFLLEMKDCQEAQIIFPDMHICPVCGSVVDLEGEVLHKPRQFYTN